MGMILGAWILSLTGKPPATNFARPTSLFSKDPSLSRFLWITGDVLGLLLKTQPFS